MPLLNIVRSTGLNYTFFTVFVFLSSKIEDEYTSILRMFCNIMNIYKISYPGVIITNKNQGLINVIYSVFPYSYNLLYR